MRRLAAALAIALASGPAVAGPRPIILTVPVTVGTLHPNLTMLRAQCMVFNHDDWRSMGNANALVGKLGEGTSQPYPTTLDGKTRGFMGDITVKIAFSNPNTPSDAVHSYRCALELYDSAQGAWETADAVAARYPLDPASLNVLQTGGALAP